MTHTHIRNSCLRVPCFCHYPPPSYPPPSTHTGYDISVRQIAQDVLPQAPHSPTSLPGCPAFFKQTDVMAYGPANVPGTPFHNWPAYSIEAQVRQ